MNIQVTRR